MSDDTITRTVTYSRSRMAEIGRKGGRRKAELHPGPEATAAGRAAFMGRFSGPEERKAYFAELGRRSWIARRKAKEDSDGTGG